MGRSSSTRKRLTIPQTGSLIVGKDPISGQKYTIFEKSETKTIAAAAYTDGTTGFIPAKTIVLGGSVRVLTAIDVASLFAVGTVASATAFHAGVAVAITTTAALNAVAAVNAAATTYRITPTSVPAVGKVRISLLMMTITPPTS